MRRILGLADTAPFGRGSVTRRLMFALILLTAAVLPVFSQTGQAPAAKDQFFTGLVTVIDDESLTVIRTAAGKNPTTKTFVVTEATRFEGGKPQVRARVTVRYVATEDGDRAVHVIVRRGPK